MTKKFDLKPTLVLSAICVVMVALLAVVNMITAPIIEAQQNAAANEALLEVLPNGKNFEEVDLSTYTMPSSIQKAWKADGGYVIQSIVTGYKDGLVIMCGIDSEGKIAGAKYIQSNETLGAENGLGDRFVGHTKDTMTIDIVAGPTAKLTTHAYYKAIEDSLSAAQILGGGEVDLRTPEEILQDNCNAALGTTDITYTKWFRVEVVEGVDEIYTDNNGAFVFVIGESFIGFDKDGSCKSENADATATAAYGIVSTSTYTKIEELPENMPKRFIEAYVTASGNYIITAKGDGFGINGDEYYHPSGKFLEITVVIAADGTIITTEIASAQETPSIGGAALANHEFIDAFLGKDKAGAAAVDTIGGATLTTQGYKNAVKVAFESFEILTATEGGNE